ncbi:peptidoglycan-binding protein [Euzebya pacifica]|uniref:peptidoglycan-binding protein n=1 Tax=Euzebya pacifica TaxID=1608957 RepID=UPI0030F8E1B0
MPIIDPSAPSASRRVVRLPAVLGVAVLCTAALGMVWAGLAVGGVAGAAETTAPADPGPTTVATAAELVVDATLEGTVERADERTLTVGGGVVAVPVSSDDDVASGDGQAAVAGLRGQKVAQDATEAPSTDPAADAPTTEAPTTEAPTTEAPSTETPTTEVAPATPSPETSPTAEPTPTTEASPTAEPTADPTAGPTAEPTAEPTTNPTAEPTAPTPTPTASEPPAVCVPDTAQPGTTPDPEPTTTPVPEPTDEPTPEPEPTPTSDDAVDCDQADAGREDGQSDGAGTAAPGGGGGGRGTTTSGGTTGLGGGTGSAGTGGTVEAGAGVATNAPTLTSIAAVGELLDLGTVAWTLDAEPVVVLVGDGVWYRDLDTDSEDGDDVALLESALVSLGYGDDLIVDTTFTSATASAVEAWETALGRTDPDGAVTTDEVVLLDAPATILRHDAVVGAGLSTGSPVLSVGGEEQLVVVPAPADESRAWEVGTPVTLLVDDRVVGTGTVSARSVAVEGGTVDQVGTRTLHVEADDDLSDRPDGSAITVSRIADGTAAAVTVPVAALVEGTDGTPAVRVVEGSTDRLTPVVIGLVVDGRAEITDGIDAGTTVRLPG